MMFIEMNDSFRPGNEPRPAEGRSAAPSVARAVKVLNALSRSAEPLGVSEIARRTQLSKSSAFAIVTALVDESLLVETGNSRRYLLGPHLAILGRRAAVSIRLNAVAAVLEQVVAATQHTGFFGRQEEKNVRVIHREDGLGDLRLSAPIGSHVPLWAGALAKAWLSAQPELQWRTCIRALREQLSSRDRDRVNEEAIACGARAALHAGYALDRGSTSKEFLVSQLAYPKLRVANFSGSLVWTRPWTMPS
jgi:DNA-binding IclR family transcriptional regulator